MRVVLDTNVLVSAALKQKSMPRMAALVVERRGGLLKSLATEQQLFEVLARPYFDSLSDPDARAWLKKLPRCLAVRFWLWRSATRNSADRSGHLPTDVVTPSLESTADLR